MPPQRVTKKDILIFVTFSGLLHPIVFMVHQELIPTNEGTDEALVKNTLEGDKKAFELLIRRHNQRLFRVGMSVLNSEADVEDAMQTAYINAYLHLDAFQGRSSFTTWLTRIMINECLGQKRRNNWVHPGIESPENISSMKTPASELGNKELTVLLESAISQLPEKYRLVFILREVEDLSVKETGEVLDIAPSNVKTRLNRAKTMLRGSLQGYMKEHVYNFHLIRCDRIVAAVLGAISSLPDR